ncbi:hypothetical protein [Anaeromyxobacter paludicola]|uniref:Uncharacterized protein n=1 Tax=Anaeromyxobacter paludicola TaxID=2918171 RepID=A0ABN6N5R9_9BACT|nr:hypothetical protein [Anaeromyxobacter paludicola]BDG07350.1 hypothetical protein AMPC_04630 [Anaeromyxobacter paludicola]
MEQLADAGLIRWAIAVIAICLVVPFTVPKVLDAWERRQEQRDRLADPRPRP